MVHCNLISYDGNTITYAIGGYTDDLTGVLRVNPSEGTYELIKEPEKTKVYDRHISAMLRRAQPAFEAGEIKKRLSYEI